mgnify:CR=1 FL=1
MSENTVPELSPKTRALIAQVEAAAPGQQTPEFTRLREGLFDAQVCTSLSDEEATARMNEVPSGTSGGWQLTTDPDLAPVACADNPSTHRHLIFEA